MRIPLCMSGTRVSWQTFPVTWKIETAYFRGDVLNYVQETQALQYGVFNRCMKLTDKYAQYIRKTVIWYRASNMASLCLSGFHRLHINTVDCQSGNQMWYEASIHICDILKTSEGVCQTFILHILLNIVGCSLDMWLQPFYSVRVVGLWVFLVFS